MIIASAWLAPRAAEIKEAWAAVITLVPMHSTLADAHARTIAELTHGSIGVTVTGLTAAGSVGEIRIGTFITTLPRVSR